MAQTTATARPTRSARLDLLDALWRFLTSVRVAIIVIAAIAVCTFIGTLVPQAANAGLFDDVAYRNWLTFQRGKFGDLVPVMEALSLFSIFQSFYFRALLVWLSIGIVLGGIVNRVPRIWRTAVHRPPLVVSERLFQVHDTARSTTLGTDVAAAVQALTETLRVRRYRVLSEQVGARTFLYADKHRFGIFGTFVSHVGLVLLMTGALIGSVMGWRDDVFTITDASMREIGRGSNLAVRNDLFVDEYDPNTGQPSDFYTNAVLLERRGDEWTELRRHRIRVNDPLEQNGIVVHQAFFGPAAVLTIKDRQGNVIFNGGVPLPYRNPDGRPLGWVEVPKGTFPLALSVFVIGRAPVGPIGDPSIQPGQVAVEVYPSDRVSPQTLLYRNLLDVGRPDAMLAPNGQKILEFSFDRERQFSGLQLSYNPGLPLIWFACGLMLVGWSAVFYFPHRRLRALVTPEGPDGARIGTVVISRLDLGMRDEHARILSALEARPRQETGLPVGSPPA